MRLAQKIALITGLAVFGTYSHAGVCALSQINCECSALFSVIETDDPEFNLRLREMAKTLRVNAYPGNGVQPVDAYIDHLIGQWRDTNIDHDGSVKLAKALASCDRFLSGDVKPPEIMVTP
jgi:hypothetical protein